MPVDVESAITSVFAMNNKSPYIQNILITFIFVVSSLSVRYSFAAEAQEGLAYGIPQVRYWSRTEYNGANQNWSISESESGLIYIANNYGIMEYDGSGFRMLPSFSSSVPRSVLSQGKRVYVGANDEIGYYENMNGVDLQYFSITSLYNIQGIGDCWGIFKFNDNIIFQGDRALVIYHPDREVQVVKARSRIPNAFVVNGMFLVHDELEGLMELRQGELFKIFGGDSFAGVRVTTVLPLSAEELLIGTMTEGLYKLGSGGSSKWNVPSNAFLRRQNIFCGLKAGDDFVFGTIQMGLVVVNSMGDIKFVVGKDKGLQNNTVLNVYMDKGSNLWTALDNGLSRMDYGMPVTFLQGYFDLGTGYCMTMKSGLAYLGTNQGLYMISEEKLGDPQKNSSDFIILEGTNGQVWELFQDAEGEVLCGHDHGVYQVAGTHAHLIGPPSVVGAWSFKYVPNRTDLLIVGTYNGLVLLKKEKNNWLFVCHIEGFDESSRFIEWDEGGNLWVAHGLKGVFKLKLNSDFNKVEELWHAEESESLKSDKNMTLGVIDGQLIFSSPQGVYSYDLMTQTFYMSKLQKLLTINGISTSSRLKQDQFGNIWYFSAEKRGVLRRLEDGSYTHVSMPFEVLANKMINGFENVFVQDQKNVFFGVEDGFAHYLQKEAVAYTQPFNVHIRGLAGANGNGEMFFVSADKNDITKQKIVPQYPFIANAFDISYSASWQGTGDIYFSTFMEGYDLEWTEWNNIRRRQYTRLSEGNYTFWVKARNVYGVETEMRGFHFQVLPPWYRSSWARVVYIVLILAILGIVYLLTKGAIEKSRYQEEMRQLDEFRKREEKLKHEALIQEKEMIKLRNEKLRDEMIHKEKELANQAIHMIQRNEFLIRVKEDLMKAAAAKDMDVAGKRIVSVVKRIDSDIDNESHWDVFETHLEQVHEEFLKRLQEKHSNLMPRELRLCAYIRMGLSSKEISALMNISSRAVENNRYKLRKKLGLEQGDNMLEYILGL